jgi:CRP/FNR family cyclic AMP-dependent transcriptional regulator
MKLETLRCVPLFRELSDEAVFDLCGLLTVQDAPSGTVLFRHGDSGDAMYLIESGCVRISVKDLEEREVTLAEFGNGEFFGEMALLDGQPRSADATVLQEARLAVLARDDFLSFLRKNPNVAIGILGPLTHRLRRTDELLRRRVSRNVNEEEAARLTIADRAADVIAEFGGSWKFIIASILLFNLWVLLNTWWVLHRAFDPFPFILLNLVLNMITALQAPIIMMSQNRQGSKDRLRADLDYRVNLKNELLLSEILRRLDIIEAERLSREIKERDNP